MTDIQTTPRFSAEMWAAFWDAPNMSLGQDILADDIVGYWPGDHEPVRGLSAYQGKIAELLGIRRSTVQNHIERAMAKLRRALEVARDDR